MLGICLDCDCTRELNHHGRCSICDSGSVVRPGAIGAVRKLISHAMKTEEENRKKNILEFKRIANATDTVLQRKGSRNA